MFKQEYLGITNDNILPLAKVSQDRKCIEYVFDLDAEVCLEYMKQIFGFKDKDAAEAFVNSAEKSSYILESDEVYDNVHAKLVDGYLKGKYTRMRNKWRGNDE